MMETESEFRDLLSKETKRQEKSYKRATLMIAIVGLIAGAWLAFSAINVIRLDARAKNLKANSTVLQQQSDELLEKSNELRQMIDTQNKALEVKKNELAKADEDLLSVKKKLEAGHPQEALRVVSDAIKVRKPTVRPTPAPGSSSQGETISIQFRGSSPLDYIERHIDLFQFENAAVFLSFSAEGGGNNTALFRKVDISSRLPQITLIELRAGNERSVIQQQLAQGKVLIVQSSIYVNGRLTKVAAFK